MNPHGGNGKRDPRRSDPADPDPSEWELQVYYRWCKAQASKVELAAEFGCSQPHIAKVLNETAKKLYAQTAREVERIRQIHTSKYEHALVSRPLSTLSVGD